MPQSLKLSKNSYFIYIEVSFLDVMTQGKTRKEALKMIEDAVMKLLKNSYEDLISKRFRLTVTLYEDGIIGMGASDDKLLFALGLIKTKTKKWINNS